MRFETSDNLPKYFKTIQKLKPLQVEEEKELVIAIQAGSQIALEKLISANLKFVVKLANRHIGQGVPIDDLIQEGNLGLLDAAVNFKPREGQRFINYAQLWIRKRLNEAVAKTGRIVRLPHNQEYDLYKSKMKGDDPAHEAPRRVAIDAPIGDEGGNTIGDIVLKSKADVDTAIDLDGVKWIVTRQLARLKERDRLIVMDYFGIDRDFEMPTEIIADRYQMTSVRVCQIVKASIQKMKLDLI